MPYFDFDAIIAEIDAVGAIGEPSKPKPIPARPTAEELEAAELAGVLAELDAI